MSTILELNNIKKAYDVKMAVDIDKLVIEDGDCVGLVGESGCGKSTLAGIITNTVKLYSGSVIFKGEDISRFNARKMRDIYKNMQMIYQSPVASFDPEYTLGKSVAEALRNNKSDNLVSELFISVGLSAEYVNKYPGQVSGGECQRAAIARALAVKPEFLICDEATSALDNKTQSKIQEAISNLKRGKRVQRQGWNGKNQYIELATNISYKNSKEEVINAEHEAIGNKAIAFVGTSGVQLGWLASQADMLAEDWKLAD